MATDDELIMAAVARRTAQMAGREPPRPAPRPPEPRPASTPPPASTPSRALAGERPQRRPRRQRNGRWAELNYFVDVGQHEFTVAERAVWLVVFRNVAPDGVVRFAIRTLADDAGVSKTTAMAAVKKMERLGYIRPARRGGVKLMVRGIPNTYVWQPVNERSGSGQMRTN